MMIYLALGIIFILSFVVKVASAMNTFDFGAGSPIKFALELIGAGIALVILMVRLVRSLAIDIMGARSAARRWSKIVRWGFSLIIIGVNIATMIETMMSYQAKGSRDVYICSIVQCSLIIEMMMIGLLSAREYSLMR